jgi:hypothetical protein
MDIKAIATKDGGGPETRSLDKRSWRAPLLKRLDVGLTLTGNNVTPIHPDQQANNRS